MLGFFGVCRTLLSALVFCLCFCIQVAFAADAEEESSPLKLYLGAGLGYSAYPNIDNNIDPPEENETQSIEDTAIGYSFFLGFEFIPDYLSVEFMYVDFGEADLKFVLTEEDMGAVDTYIDEVTTSVEAYGISLRASYPVTSHISVYGKLGYSKWEFSDDYSYSVYYDGEYEPDASGSDSFSDGDEDFFYALGAEYQIGDQLNIYGEYLYQNADYKAGGQTFDIFEASSLMFGVRWEFDIAHANWKSGTNKRATKDNRGLTACDEKFKDTVGGVICETQ
ncbi:MAG: outer membrane beta-barrel protein [Pseudomonadales bacterium]|nr:outer membrane beta-barrel protein [Pseudomonadales bacterium]